MIQNKQRESKFKHVMAVCVRSLMLISSSTAAAVPLPRWGRLGGACGRGRGTCLSQINQNLPSPSQSKPPRKKIPPSKNSAFCTLVFPLFTTRFSTWLIHRLLKNRPKTCGKPIHGAKICLWITQNPSFPFFDNFSPEMPQNPCGNGIWARFTK